MDVAFALIGLLLTWPLFVFIATSVRAQDGGAAIFRQQRIGRDGRMFDCFKFRSMRMGAEQALPSASDPEWQAMRKLMHTANELDSCGQNEWAPRATLGMFLAVVNGRQSYSTKLSRPFAGSNRSQKKSWR